MRNGIAYDPFTASSLQRTGEWPNEPYVGPSGPSEACVGCSLSMTTSTSAFGASMSCPTNQSQTVARLGGAGITVPGITVPPGLVSESGFSARFTRTWLGGIGLPSIRTEPEACSACKDNCWVVTQTTCAAAGWGGFDLIECWSVVQRDCFGRCNRGPCKKGPF